MNVQRVKQVDALSTSLIWRVEVSPVQPIANSAGFVHLGAALKLRLASDQGCCWISAGGDRCLFQLQSWASAAAISVRIARSCTITSLFLYSH